MTDVLESDTRDTLWITDAEMIRRMRCPGKAE